MEVIYSWHSGAGARRGREMEASSIKGEGEERGGDWRGKEIEFTEVGLE